MLHRNSLFPILSDRRRGRRSNPNNWSMQVTFLTPPMGGGGGQTFFFFWYTSQVYRFNLLNIMRWIGIEILNKNLTRKKFDFSNIDQIPNGPLNGVGG